MKVTRILAALALVTCFAASANADGCIRASWNGCDPWVANQDFAGPATYNLVISAIGVSHQNVGTDLNLHIYSGQPGGAVADAWRFDDSGCQTSSQLVTSTAGFSKTCPVLKGLNSLTIVNYSINGTGQADLRLAITYDTFIPSAATRYTLWQLQANHAFSAAGPSDAEHCGGAEVCEWFYFNQAILLAATGQPENFTGCDVPVNVAGQPAASWQASLAGTCPVENLPTTWGKVKGLYR